MLPGISSDEGRGDGRPAIHDQILKAEILILATPTWIGQPSSIVKSVLERLDTLLSETDDDGRPVAFNRVAGFVVTGNEEGAHHVIAELTQGVTEVGFPVPGQAWPYWNMGPRPGPDYSDPEHRHDWSHATGPAAASNLVAEAKALAANPIPAAELAAPSKLTPAPLPGARVYAAAKKRTAWITGRGDASDPRTPR